MILIVTTFTYLVVSKLVVDRIEMTGHIISLISVSLMVCLMLPAPLQMVFPSPESFVDANCGTRRVLNIWLALVSALNQMI